MRVVPKIPSGFSWWLTSSIAEIAVSHRLSQLVAVEVQVRLCRSNLAICDASEPLNHRLIGGISPEARQVALGVIDAAMCDPNTIRRQIPDRAACVRGVKISTAYRPTGPERACGCGPRNGHEFVSKSLDWWAYFNGVKLDFSRPGKPTDNAFIESFNGKFRQECLNQHWFLSLEDAQDVIEAWRKDYNQHRPHSALGDRSPVEFANFSRGACPP